MTLVNFLKLWAALCNIENHTFGEEIFVWFDKDVDGLVDFEELIKGLDVAERGSFLEKSTYCY